MDVRKRKKPWLSLDLEKESAAQPKGNLKGIPKVGT